MSIRLILLKWHQRLEFLPSQEGWVVNYYPREFILQGVFKKIIMLWFNTRGYISYQMYLICFHTYTC